MSRTAKLAILVIILTVLAAGATMVTLVALFLSNTTAFDKPHVLALRLEGTLPEHQEEGSVAWLLGRRSLSLRDVVEGIEQARKDEDIKGLMVEIGPVGLGWAQSEEVRSALAGFRQSGKWSVAFLESADSNAAYWLATGCEQIVLAPPGEVGLVGLRVETPFLRGLLDKLGVVPQMARRKEYKNAANTYTETSYTPAHREATQALLRSLYRGLVAGIADSRGLTDERVEELIDGGPYTAQEALAHELVDRLAYKDELLSQIEDSGADVDSVVRLGDYLQRHRLHTRGRRKIALIYATGTIARGESDTGPLSGSVMGSRTIIRALQRARKDRAVAAVVLRIDSPGGSYVASDLIRREVVLTAKEKPVIASMGNVAASGGYFIAMQADHIVADEATITGSIGVLSGKLVTRRFWQEKTGIRFPGIQIGENAEIFSSQEPYDERGWERLNRILDTIYADFVAKAAEGRSMEFEQLEPLAHGRVWTGRDALDRGLIDEIGGLGRAIVVAAERGGLDPEGPYRLITLPRPRGFLDSLRRSRSLGLSAELPPPAADLLRAAALVERLSGECYLYASDLPVVR